MGGGEGGWSVSGVAGVESFKRQQRACVYETAMFNSSPLFL